MRVFDNGVYRDMTPEELAEYEAAANQPTSEPTTDERLAAIEAQFKAMEKAYREGVNEA